MVEIEKVKDVAQNARIKIDRDEANNFAKQFEEILGMFDKLDNIDTKDVKPAFHPVKVKPELRSDEKEESLEEEKVFQNTENREDGYFKGPSA